MKRTLDVTLGLAGLVAAAIPILIIAALVRLRLGAPVLFVQRRAGLNGRTFRLLKFRTMTDERGPDGELLHDDRRMTAFGRALRATSLDQLPELFNVLQGDMSLVGPRPLLAEYWPLYSDYERRRHLVRPGMTGWAQVNGRNLLSWEDRFALDVWYVDHHSIGLDLRIIALTLPRVLRSEAVKPRDRETMPTLTELRSPPQA